MTFQATSSTGIASTASGVSPKSLRTIHETSAVIQEKVDSAGGREATGEAIGA